MEEGRDVRDEYTRRDEKGRWINTEFPPESFSKYPTREGYRTINAMLLFYEYAIMCYCLEVHYKGASYRVLWDGGDESCVTDMDYNQISDTYSTPIELLKRYRFPDGNTLVDLAYMSEKEASIDIH